MDGLEAVESLDLFFAKLSLHFSLCSFNLLARSFWVNGVTKRWILGALLTSLPALLVK
nr:hypothetical protein [Tanacetum cinerariifolium]